MAGEMDGHGWLMEIRALYRSHKDKCERAAAQVSDREFMLPLGTTTVSIGILMKHLGGNHRSRWRDFLTTDGEKADRNRDGEFSDETETRDTVRAQWEEGWRITFGALESLEPADLERTVTIRGEPHSVVQAIQRNLAHLAYHTGQIVLLARHHAGDAWQSLSVPPGKSDEHNAEMAARHGDWMEKS